MDWIETYIDGVASFVKSKGGREIWMRAANSFDKDFVAAIDKRSESIEYEWLDLLLD